MFSKIWISMNMHGPVSINGKKIFTCTLQARWLFQLYKRFFQSVSKAAIFIHQAQIFTSCNQLYKLIRGDLYAIVTDFPG